MKLPGFVNPNAFMPVRWLYKGLTWRIPTDENKIYLTFDDGPVPEITPWVLEQLDKYKAKATFFCVGENAEKNPEIFNTIKSSGHKIGNHTYHHLNGWKTENKVYFEDIKKADKIIQSNLFRPPYGKIKKSQINFLLSVTSPLQATSSIIMWDVLSFDFDINTKGEKCFQNIIYHTRPGSIIVMHDSVKAGKNLMYALPKILEYYSERGFRFEKIPG